MKPRDLFDLLALAVLWGAGYLFIRVAVPEFGAVALIEVRMVLAAAILAPLVLARGQLAVIVGNWKPIAVMGVMHYAIPFSLYAWAMLELSAGYASIINAASPLFVGVVARLWVGERLTASRVTGLVLGIGGVVLLVLDTLLSAEAPDLLPVVAAITASFCYGFAAVYARQRLTGVNPTAIAAGSMASAALVLLPLTLWLFPKSMPSADAWGMAALAGVLSTALAFILYFRLIASVGPSKAITVTFLVPVFAVVCGALFIGEAVTPPMVVGGVVIAAGTALATGLVSIRLPGQRVRALVARVAIIGFVLMAADDIPADLHSPGASAPDSASLRDRF